MQGQQQQQEEEEEEEEEDAASCGAISWGQHAAAPTTYSTVLLGVRTWVLASTRYVYCCRCPRSLY